VGGGSKTVSFFIDGSSLGSRYRLGFCAVLIASSCVILPAPARAQNLESSLVQAMQGLAVTWQNLSQTQQVLIIDCLKGGFTGVRLTSGAKVGVDLQKTNSIMSPYVGIVYLTGRFEQNINHYDQSCSRTKQEAMRNTDWGGNDLIFDFQIYYQIHGNELWLTAGNSFFQNAFLSQPGPPEVDPNTDWLRAFRYPLPGPPAQR
jgi:hypothetical protein